MTEAHRREIAARLHALIGKWQGAELSILAQILGVDDVSLRLSIDPISPYPTLEVLTAVVTHYGIDPTYLLTGRYEAGSHRHVLQDPDAARQVIRQLLLVAPEARIAQPTDEPRLHSA